MYLQYIFLYVIINLTKAEIFTSVPSKLEQIVYQYPNQIREEKDLPLCGPAEVCGTEHKRFWFPTRVKRFCHCKKGECSKVGATLNNRSVINVCSIPLKEECPEEEECREPCSNGEVGLEVKKDAKSRSIITLNCNCEAPAYWLPAARIENSTLIHERYACSKLKLCQADDFCGHIQSDIYSMYLQCDCPKNHICLNKDQSERNITEALYEGPAMRAYCILLKKNNYAYIF